MLHWLLIDLHGFHALGPTFHPMEGENLFWLAVTPGCRFRWSLCPWAIVLPSRRVLEQISPIKVIHTTAQTNSCAGFGLRFFCMISEVP